MSTERICVAICTRERPQMLRRCLDTVLPQLDAAAGDWVVVVENGPAGPAAPAIAAFQDAVDAGRLRLAHEPEEGIPFARNHCLRHALAGDADWIAFIDDDEWADPDWLARHRAAARDLGAAALTGPVRYIYPDALPAWYKPRRPQAMARGAALNTAATSNAMVDLRWVRAELPDLAFDEALRFTGGSDTDFFYRITDAGGALRWVDDAHVSEDVLPEQLTMRWQLRRTERYSANNVYFDFKRKSRATTYLKNGRRAAKRILFGLVSLPFCYAVCLVSYRTGSQMAFSSLKKVYAGVGAFRGLFGKPPEPYRSVIGS